MCVCRMEIMKKRREKKIKEVEENTAVLSILVCNVLPRYTSVTRRANFIAYTYAYTVAKTSVYNVARTSAGDEHAAKSRGKSPR